MSEPVTPYFLLMPLFWWMSNLSVLYWSLLSLLNTPDVYDVEKYASLHNMKLISITANTDTNINTNNLLKHV